MTQTIPFASSSKDYNLSIELLPEFGWSIRDQPVYGPGSVFQGFVKVHLDAVIPVERVRLAFYAIETIPPFDVVPGSLRVAKRTLFSIQQTLWDCKGQTSNSLDIKSNHVFPFTIQMPMIQFPPTCQHEAYRCNFQLIAILDAPSLGNNAPLIKTEIPVVCMPFVETSLLKNPLMARSEKGDLAAVVRMRAQEYVPGDVIPVSLRVDKKKNSGSSSKKNSIQYVTVNIKLKQILSIVVFDDMQDQIKTICSASHKMILIDGAYCDADLSLKIPADASPSYDYGQLVNISYRLEVSAEQKGPLGGIWTNSVEIDNIDITIGTLGYGIRTASDMKLYTDYASDMKLMPVPKFMKAIEYEDALPVYDPAKLPGYENAPTFAAAQVMLGC